MDIDRDIASARKTFRVCPLVRATTRWSPKGAPGPPSQGGDPPSFYGGTLNISILRRSSILAGIPVALLGATMLPAEALSSAGLVSVQAIGPSGAADGDCAYTATLPSTNGFNYISVDFTGEARATPSKAGVAAISTSIRCYLRNQASGDAGITLVGPTAAITGTGDVYRLAPDPEICAVTSAAFSDGTVAPPTTVCHNL
jgi:hypothetical protein